MQASSLDYRTLKEMCIYFITTIRVITSFFLLLVVVGTRYTLNVSNPDIFKDTGLADAVFDSFHKNVALKCFYF